MENGDMMNYVSKFLSKFGSAIKNRDVVLVASANQLVREGLVGYVKSFLDVAELIRLGNRRECCVLPAPFLLLGSCADAILIRYILEFHAWVRICGIDPEGVLNDAFGIRQSPGEKIGKMQDATYKLPINVHSKKESCVFSEGPTNLPKGVVPFSESTEKLVITSLLRNLREYKNLNIDCDPCFDRAPTNSSQECCEYLVIGGGHAARLTEAQKHAGGQCHLIELPTYRASTIHAGKIREGLSGVVIGPEMVIVMQVFDNAFYMTSTEEGGLIPLSKDIEGTYHCFGELVLTPKELQWKFFQQVVEEISGLKNNKLILLAPLPKYWEAACSNKEDQVVNRGSSSFKKTMEDNIFQIRGNLKDFAFRAGIRKVKTISTWKVVRKAGASWSDGVHLDEDSYTTIARVVQEAAADLDLKRPAT
jgi:hypothetical protein